MAIEKIKILGAVLELPAKQHCQFLPIQPIHLENGPNGLNWQCCLAGSSKTAPRILIFFNCHGCQLFIWGRQKKLTYSNEFWKLPQLWTKVRKFHTEYGLLWGHCYELFVCGDLDWISRNTWRDIHRIWIFYHLKISYYMTIKLQNLLR